MALPVPQGVGAKAEGTDIDPAWPAHQTGDVGLLCLEVRFGDDVPDPTGDGWAVVENSPQGFVGGGTVSTTLGIFWKRATSAAEAAPNLVAANHIVAGILTFRGCVATNEPYEEGAGDGDSLATASTSVSIPGGETTVNDCLIVAAAAMGQDTATEQLSDWANSDLANVTERADYFTAVGNGGGFGVATGELASAGTYGVTTATSASSFAQGRISLALLPAEDEGTDATVTLPAAGIIRPTASAPAFAVSDSATLPAGTLSVTAEAPDLHLSTQVAQPAAGVLAATATAPTLRAGVDAQPTAGILRLTATAPTLTGANAEERRFVTATGAWYLIKRLRG